jgi:hypothetical protein
MSNQTVNLRYALLSLFIAVGFNGPLLADDLPSAAENFAENPSDTPEGPQGGVSLPGNVWDNGPANGINALTSERDTNISGTGGPEGDHASTIADDFDLASNTNIEEIRVCLYHDGTTAELYIYSDSAGAPGPAVNAPLFGAPTTASVVSTTSNDNTSRCLNDFGFPGRQ